MPRHHFPWWFHYLWENRLRRLVQHPERVLAPYVREGMQCIEIGCGMGFFTVPLAQTVGPAGRVVAVDVKEPLLDTLRRRARRAGVNDRIETSLTPAEELEADLRADFVLAVWSLHELDDGGRAARRIVGRMKTGACMLVAEPKWHVGASAFWRRLEPFLSAGLALAGTPKVGISHAAVLARPAEPPDACAGHRSSE
ncbi:MAG: class I SAM-dependent methyltransferase [Planctomycetota bacterium]